MIPQVEEGAMRASRPMRLGEISKKKDLQGNGKNFLQKYV